jgi:Tfp pilus assembly PilM family ATPase
MKALHNLAASLSPCFLGNRPLHVGLHVAGERINAAQMQHTPAGLSLHAVGSLDLGCPWYALLCKPRRFKPLLKRFWAEQGFSGAEVVAALPQEQLKVFTVEYSAAQGQADSDAIAAEVKDRLKGKPRAMVVDFVPVGNGTTEDRTREALVSVAARDDVTAFLDLLAGAGLTARALDISGMALRRLPLAREWAEQPRNALILHIGATSSQLVLILDRHLVLDRTLDFSEQRLVSRVARLLDLPEPAARRLLVERESPATPSAQTAELERVLREIAGSDLVTLKAEVSKTLDYAASKTHGNGVDKIALLGAFANVPAIGQFLSSAFAKPVERLDPLSLFPHGLTTEQAAQIAPHAGGVAVAIGLALRGLPER